jgi:hypothetical protein
MHYGQDQTADQLTRGSSSSNLVRLPLGQTPAPSLGLLGAPSSKVSWRSDQPNQKIFTIAEPQENEEIVFDRLVALKMLASGVAMHLEASWRGGLFRQLDNLLDVEEWDFSDDLPSVESFRTFLRMVIFSRLKNRPSIGATADGRIIAAWASGKDRLTIECLPNDRIRFVLIKYIGDERISNAGTAPVQSLRAYLQPYEPEKWFGEDHQPFR